MFIILNIIVAILFATVVLMGLALRKARVLTSADEKLINTLADRLGDEFTVHLDTIFKKEDAEREAKYWRESAYGWRARAFTAARALAQHQTTIENLSKSVETLDDLLTEAENVGIENAKRILGGIEVEDLQQGKAPAEVEQMLTANTGTLHDRDEWCDRFGCQPAPQQSLSHRAFENDTGEDIEVPIDYYVVDRGE